MTAAGPNTDFFAAILGFFLLGWEMARPGAIIPGILGLALILFGCYGLVLHAADRLGLAYLALAMLLYAAEAFCNVRFVAALLALAAAGFGLYRLTSGPPHISAALVATCGAAWALSGVPLARIVRRARERKRLEALR